MRYIFLLACVQVSLASAGTLEIVIPSRPLKTVELAADELADHVEMSVGVRPKIRSEDQATLTPQGVRFWVGATQAARAAGLPQRPFRADEHVVRIEGRDVYLLGGDRDGTGPADTGGKALSGTLYAVCDFLEHELGVRWLLAQPNLKAVLCGHLHAEARYRLNGHVTEFIAGATMNGQACEVTFA